MSENDERTDAMEPVFQFPEGVRPPVDLLLPAVGKRAEIVTILIRADGWVWANPNDSPINFAGVQFTVD